VNGAAAKCEIGSSPINSVKKGGPDETTDV